ncbi:MAG: SDR family oxidoreductase [Chloroflexi bacterium]|nr:SDR family oxidoreductase [Chloroflexota bacterium]
MDLGLKETRVLVAASSRGLGRATARQFALEGARVAINGRDPSDLEGTAAELSKDTGADVIALPGDVADPRVAEAVVQGAVEHFGGLDVLVTNAGGPPAGTFESTPLDAWEEAFQLTVMSAVRLIHAALPHLRQSDRAAILTITSTSIKQPIDSLILSNSVRMAVGGLTKSLAAELGPEGIRVNSILPGWTRTGRVEELLQAQSEARGITVAEALQTRTTSIPLGRMADPEEFARVAVFLCSSAASYVHGVLLPVDGGSIKATL